MISEIRYETGNISVRYLHGGTVEVDFTKLEDQHIVTVLGNRNVIAKIGMVVSFSLIEDGIWFWHPTNVEVLPPII